MMKLFSQRLTIHTLPLWLALLSAIAFGQTTGSEIARFIEGTEQLKRDLERVERGLTELENLLDIAEENRPIASKQVVAPPTFSGGILPILTENCFTCHGPDQGQRKAGLRLDDRDAVLQPAGSGETPIVPGNRDLSEIYRRISSTDPSERMPPDADKHLTPEEIESIGRWIDNGAEWDRHWAFEHPSRPTIPEVPDPEWVRNPIDSFILSRLGKEKLKPSPEADRATLVRRLSLDLIGLPPTPAEIDAFLSDEGPGAYEDLVDRLLASPHYGEKWARWWLDLCGYADSDGYLSDFLRPWAWRYRDWLVHALNEDMSFYRFTIEQLAGDLLPEADLNTKMATGFLRNTLSNREGGAALEEFRAKQVIQRTSMVGTVWLGLTVGCAECHDHKYDPLTQREFYQLYSFFNNVDEVNVPAPLGDEWEEYVNAKPKYDEERKKILEPIREEIDSLQKDWESELLFTEANPGRGYDWERALEVLGLVWGQGEGEGQLEGLLIVKTPWEERTEDQQRRLQDYFLRSGSIIDATKFSELKIGEKVKQLDELESVLPKVSRAPSMFQTPMKRMTHIHVRGNYRDKGAEVVPQTPVFLSLLTRSEDLPRLKLARWLASEENPLAARVTVNRLWQQIFGRGLVATSDDFGIRGSLPSHPELLDWLAVEFMDGDWSLKSMLKEIVISAAYRQTSDTSPALSEKDPDNVLLARFPRMRLSAEAVRDSALKVSGLLNTEIGGPSIRPQQPDSVTKEGFDNKWEASEGKDRHRRGLYIFLQRTSPFAQLVNFDLPDVNRSCTRRERSNTPLQALNLLNDPNFFEAAQALGRRVQAFALKQTRENGGATVEECIAHAFRLCLGRTPTTEELTILSNYLARQIDILRSDPDSAVQMIQQDISGEEAIDLAAWTGLASVLLNLDEFIMKG